MFKVLDEVCEPKRATKYSACVDLFAREDVVIGAGETKIVPLGVKIDADFFLYEIGRINVGCDGIVISTDNASKDIENFLKSHYLALFIRSSLALKGLIIPNGQGVIDLDYSDEIGLIVHNPVERLQNFQGGYCEIYPDTYYINKGDKVAQATLKEHKGYLMGYESEEERTGGFGSSGK